MTKLSPAQTRLLEKLKSQKDGYEHWLEDAEAEFARLKEEKKNPIRETVAQAIEDNIPVRQIHIKGLGYQQVGSMEKFLAPKAESLSARLARVTQPVQPGEEVKTFVQASVPLRVRETDNENEWWITDEADDDWMVHVIPTGGQWFVINANDLENATGDVRQALMDHKPGRVHWGTEDLD